MEPKPPVAVEAPPAEIAQRVSEAVANFEREIGGRQALVAALQHAPPSAEIAAVVAVIADPSRDASSLAEICRDAGMSVSHLSQVFCDARRAAMHASMLASVGGKLQGVLDDVLAHSVEHDAPCDVCFGQPLSRVKGKPRTCQKCRGTGKVRRPSDIRRQELALEMGGLIERGAGGVNVNVNQQTAVFDVHAAMGTFQRASDRVLAGGRGAPPQTAGVIDVESNEALPRRE